MGTSRSAEWLAQALVYSGRPDPAWVVPGSTVDELLDLWAGLPPRPDSGPEPPPLGYRGCLLRASDGRTWRSYGGAVTLSEGNFEQARDDSDHRFEQTLLATAPPGTLPPMPAY
jgi:hypothetical protein